MKYQLLSAALLLSACGPAVQSGRYSAAPLPPSNDEVTIYSTRLPSCAYDEVGMDRVEKRTGFTSLQSMIDAMRDRARNMGGDAVVRLIPTGRTEHASTDPVTQVITNDTGLTGVVVKFKDASCRN
ncbi:MAG TPA: hypothetical protein VM100_12575 [Longimicrobiales bacterium]|nr:hypothetical protein [Longimicrobiales bacterium]